MVTTDAPARPVEISDPNNVPETVVNGPFNIMRMGAMVLFTFTVMRPDATAIFSGNKNPPAQGRRCGPYPYADANGRGAYARCRANFDRWDRVWVGTGADLTKVLPPAPPAPAPVALVWSARHFDGVAYDAGFAKMSDVKG